MVISSITMNLQFLVEKLTENPVSFIFASFFLVFLFRIFIFAVKVAFMPCGVSVKLKLGGFFLYKNVF